MKTTNNFSDFFANVEPTKFAIKVNAFWLDLSKFDDFAQFKQFVLDLCKPLFKEIRFVDYKGIPKELFERFTFANECLFEEAFEDFLEYESANAETKRAYEHYLRDMDSLGTFGEFTARYEGYFGSEEDFAIQYVEQIGLLDGISSDIANYFDYAAYGRDLFLNGDFTYCNGFVFGC